MSHQMPEITEALTSLKTAVTKLLADDRLTEAASVLRGMEALVSHLPNTVFNLPSSNPMVPTPSEQYNLRNGRKIEAIKDMRHRTGAGLKEAKEACEAWMRANNLPW